MVPMEYKISNGDPMVTMWEAMKTHEYSNGMSPRGGEKNREIPKRRDFCKKNKCNPYGGCAYDSGENCYKKKYPLYRWTRLIPNKN